jgi:hypothetical protein
MYVVVSAGLMKGIAHDQNSVLFAYMYAVTHVSLRENSNVDHLGMRRALGDERFTSEPRSRCVSAKLLGRCSYHVKSIASPSFRVYAVGRPVDYLRLTTTPTSSAGT